MAYSLYLKVGRSLPVLSALVFFQMIALAGGLERVTEGSYRDSRAGVGAAFLFSPAKLPSGRHSQPGSSIFAHPRHGRGRG